MKKPSNLTLRPYQKNVIQETRAALKNNRAVAIQLPTGAGKSHIFAAITEMAFEKNNRVWICVPRNELIWQSSEHLFRRNVPHGIIAAGRNESRAFKVHVISMETIKRRLKADKIKNFPDIIIFDECHIQLTAQIWIVSQLPQKTKVIGFSATMERLDGRGIGISKDKDGKYLDGLYDTLVSGPDVKGMIEMGYLSKFRYFCPPLEGLNELHVKRGELDANEFEAFMKRRAVYGKAINHYKELANGKKALVYCRSVKSAEETAARFRDAGYNFESIDGKMTDRQRKDRINALKSGSLQGLTNCDLATYGLDVPSVEVIIMLRHTFSLSLYFQMIGRGLRLYPGKEQTIILDHVNNLLTHFHPLSEYDWNFYGIEKRKIKKQDNEEINKLCSKCWNWYTGSVCDFCGHGRSERTKKAIQEIEGKLEEQSAPIPLSARPYEEKREFHEKISSAKLKYYESVTAGQIDYSAIQEVIDIADICGYSIMWVYHQLNNLEKMVNVSLLHAIRHVKGFKTGWVYFKRKELQKRNRQEEAK